MFSKGFIPSGSWGQSLSSDVREQYLNNLFVYCVHLSTIYSASTQVYFKHLLYLCFRDTSSNLNQDKTKYLDVMDHKVIWTLNQIGTLSLSNNPQQSFKARLIGSVNEDIMADHTNGSKFKILAVPIKLIRSEESLVLRLHVKCLVEVLSGLKRSTIL